MISVMLVIKSSFHFMSCELRCTEVVLLGFETATARSFTSRQIQGAHMPGIVAPITAKPTPTYGAPS